MVNPTPPSMAVVGGDTNIWGTKTNDLLRWIEDSISAANTLVSSLSGTLATTSTTASTALTTATAANAAASSAFTTANNAIAAASSASTSATGATAAATSAQNTANTALSQITGHLSTASTGNPHPQYVRSVNGVLPDASGNVIIAANGTSGGTGGTTGGTGGTTGGGGLAGISKLLIIIEENHTADELYAGMPYLASVSEAYAYVNNWHAVGHPSLPNYLAIAGGSMFGITDDGDPSSHVLAGHKTIFGQAIQAGKTAKTYAESMPSNAYGHDSGYYTAHHNPWPYFTDETAYFNTYDVPLGTSNSGAFAADIANNALPHIGFVVPNVQNDAHDGTLGQADGWLNGWLPKIMATQDYVQGRLLVIITADEDDSSGSNVVLTTFVHPALTNRGQVDGLNLSHYSLSRLASDIVGATPLNNAVGAPAIDTAFNLGLAIRGATNGGSGGGTSGGTGGGGGGGSSTNGSDGFNMGASVINFFNLFQSSMSDHYLGAVGTWQDTQDSYMVSDALSADLGSWNRIIDLAVGGVFVNGGETWGQAASGGLDGNWAQMLSNIKTRYGSRDYSKLHLRFCHEFNLSGNPFRVFGGDAANFVAAFRRFYGMAKASMPGVQVMFSVNDGTSSSLGLDVRNCYPGDAYCDAISVDCYNAWPHVTDASGFNSKINETDQYGAPVGLEKWRQFALAHGKYMVISEWGNPAIDDGSGGGGGDAPGYIQNFLNWCYTNGGSGAGNLKYSVYFNIGAAGGFSSDYLIITDGSQALHQPNASAAIKQYGKSTATHMA